MYMAKIRIAVAATAIIAAVILVGCLRTADDDGNNGGDVNSSAADDDGNNGSDVNSSGGGDLGKATRIGSGLGIGEEYVYGSGLAVIGDTLYMVEEGSNALYTLNTTTGIATRVGESEMFGGDIGPFGLAALNDTLYMEGISSDNNDFLYALYTLTTDTGIAKRVGRATNFGLSFFAGADGLAALNGTLYLAGPELYTLNTTTGIAAPVGNLLDSFNYGTGITGGDLAALNGTLFMVGRDLDNSIEYILTDALYTINVSTGVATQVGNMASFGMGIAGGGLAALNGILYMTGVTLDSNSMLAIPTEAALYTLTYR